MSTKQVESVKSPEKRDHHLRVPVNSTERAAIQALADTAGMSIARYLRNVGQGYRVRSVVDYEQVHVLACINGDLGRLGGLLKLWLTDDARTAQFGKETILAVLDKSVDTMETMEEIMLRIVKPRSDHAVKSPS